MITELIDTLASSDSLINPLHQTLVLARRIDNSELASWLLNELHGYSSEESKIKFLYQVIVSLNIR